MMQRKYTIVITEDERLEILNALKELNNPYEPESISALIAEFENLGGDKK